MAEDQAPKIHIDADWKAQAQAEKQRLAEQEKAKSAASPTGAAGAAGAAGPEAGAGQPGELPPANFETLLSSFVTQALFALGAIADPRSGQRYISLDLARHHIDMLSVLEEKTKGNLTEEESDTLSTTLYELRNRYVQVAEAARQAGRQQAQGQGG